MNKDKMRLLEMILPYAHGNLPQILNIISAFYEWVSDKPKEISDEEIQKVIEQCAYDDLGGGRAFTEGLIKGAKWYREQLKSKQ